MNIQKNYEKKIILSTGLTLVGLFVLIFNIMPQGASAQILLEDKFEDKDKNAWKSRWEIHDDGTDGAPSKWFIGPEGGIPDGAFGTPTNILRGGGPSKKDEQAGCYALTLKAGSENWTDYRVSADMYHMDNDYAGLFLRYIDELNYFRVWSKQEEVIQANRTSYGMDKVVKGNWTVFFGVGNGPGGDGIDGPAVPKDIKNTPQRTWFTMVAEVIGDTVTMYLKETPKGQAKKVDSVKDKDLAPGGPLERGKIALYNSTNPMAYDNVLVENLAAVEPADKLSTTWANIKANYY